MQLWLVERSHPKDQRELHFQDFFEFCPGFHGRLGILSGRTRSRSIRDDLILSLYTLSSIFKIFEEYLAFRVIFFKLAQSRALCGTLVWAYLNQYFQ